MIPKWGYCAVTADFLHIGHIRFIKKCSQRCHKLIVGIMTDDCVENYKGHRPIMTQWQRREVVKSLKFVYKTMFQSSFEFSHNVKYMKVFYRDDFVIFDNKKHHREGADILFPYMEGISSSMFRRALIENSDNSKRKV